MDVDGLLSPRERKIAEWKLLASEHGMAVEEVAVLSVLHSTADAIAAAGRLGAAFEELTAHFNRLNGALRYEGDAEVLRQLGIAGS